MADKVKADADLPNDDDETLSPEEQAALSDRSTVGQANREAEAEAIKAAEQPEPEPTAKERDEVGRFLGKDKPAESNESAKAEPEKDEDNKVVPRAALIAERKEWQARLQEEAEKRAKLDAKLDLLAQRFNKPPEQPKTVEEDPISALKALQASDAQRQQFEAQQAQRVQFTNAVSAQVRQFRATEAPDYDDAYKHLIKSREQELQIMGYTSQEVQQIIAQDEFSFSAAALQRGINPAKAAYELAKSKGYRKAETVPVAEQTKGPKLEEKLEAEARGRAAAKSLSSGGSAPPAKITLADIDSMSEDEIAALSPEKFRAMFGM